MSLMSICPACGSDWCSGAECVRKEYAGLERERDSAMRVLSRQIQIVEAQQAVIQTLRSALEDIGYSDDMDQAKRRIKAKLKEVDAALGKING